MRVSEAPREIHTFHFVVIEGSSILARLRTFKWAVRQLFFPPSARAAAAMPSVFLGGVPPQAEPLPPVLDLARIGDLYQQLGDPTQRAVAAATLDALLKAWAAGLRQHEHAVRLRAAETLIALEREYPGLLRFQVELEQ